MQVFYTSFSKRRVHHFETDLYCSVLSICFGTFNIAPSDPLSEEPVYDENVTIGNRQDTLEASSTLGRKCSVAICPIPALEDFDQSRNEVSTTS